MIKKALVLCSAFAISGQAMAYQATGHASWYGPGFDGRKTASGERFSKHALTAAHKTLPLHSRVLVTNLSNNESVVVRINDRGPYSRGRLIDLSQAAAQAIGLHGVGRVAVTDLE
jgi:rare lipoprotein A